MFGLSFWEIALILMVALVVLGPKRLPDAARTLGRGLRSLRRASSDIRSVIEEPLREVQEPLQEMRNDLYEAVNQFGDDVVESVRDIGAESKELPGEASEDDRLLAEGEEPEGEPSQPVDDEIEEQDGRRIASTDPFGGTDGEDQGLGEESGPSLLAAGAEPELLEEDASNEPSPAVDPATHEGKRG